MKHLSVNQGIIDFCYYFDIKQFVVNGPFVQPTSEYLPFISLSLLASFSSFSEASRSFFSIRRRELPTSINVASSVLQELQRKKVRACLNMHVNIVNRM